jgi:hypothetical protein
MRIHDKAFRSWVVLGLVLLLLIAVHVAVLAHLASAVDRVGAAPVTLVLLGMVLLCGAQAWHLTLRSARARHCGNSPLYLSHVVGELDADDVAVRRQALRTLADFYDEPFGAVNLFWGHPEQLDALCVLYREWWRATQTSETKPAQPPEQVAAQAAAANLQPQVPPVIEKPVAPRWAETPAESYPRGPSCPLPAVLEQLPRMGREDFLKAMLPSVEDALLLVADLVNDADDTGTFLRARQRVPELFTELGWEALERGWQMRFDAEEEQKRQQQQLSWAARFRRMKMAEVGLLPTSEPAEPSEPPRTDGEPEAASWQEILHTLRGQLEQKLDRLADVIKDALLDGGAGGLHGEATREPLPPLARAEFIEAMRGRVEQGLGQMADVLDHADNAEGVREVLAELLWDALNLSARLRVAASAPAAAPAGAEGSYWRD